ncbi:hypothetical protein D3C80_1737910 [compost metagenome]
MRTSLTLLACLSAASPALAFDLTTQLGVATTYVTSDVSSRPFEKRLLASARDDAASFIASDERIRGARLEQSLHWLRQEHPGLHASDRELAEAILAQTSE